jgi:hypothetical protein
MARWREVPVQSILELLPPELHRSAYPAWCLCSRCSPGSVDGVECVRERWSQDRREWCRAHGYSVLDLLRAEVDVKRRRG